MGKLSFLEMIFICGIVFGILGLFFSAVLLFFTIFSDYLPSNKLSHNLKDKTLKISQFAANFGQIIFFLTLAGFFAYSAFDGIKNGQYNLAFSRYGNMNSNINWSNRPIRFALQTVLFIVLSGYLQYVLIKTLGNIFKKNQT